jgi:hypothetical protein
MRHLDYRAMIDRGRKAGLGAAELYQAMSAHHPEAGTHSPGATDGNGFVTAFDRHGQRIYRPKGRRSR